MIKFKQGSLTNLKGQSKDIVVEAKSTVNIKDLLMGGALVAMGIFHLTASAFKKGSMCHEEAEFQTMCDLGIITSEPEEKNDV